MTASVPVEIVGEANPSNTAGPVGTKLCTFRWILDKIEVVMSHYSSKIGYRGATYPSNLGTIVAQWIALHLTSEKIEDRFQLKAIFPSISFFLIFFKSMCFLSFVGNVITYFIVISYRTTAFFFLFPNLK